MSSKSDHDNRSNQLNPNNDAYWRSRGGQDDDDNDDDIPARKHPYVSAAGLDYSRRLAEARAAAIEKGLPPPDSVPVFV